MEGVEAQPLEALVVGVALGEVAAAVEAGGEAALDGLELVVGGVGEGEVDGGGVGEEGADVGEEAEPVELGVLVGEGSPDRPRHAARLPRHLPRLLDEAEGGVDADAEVSDGGGWLDWEAVDEEPWRPGVEVLADEEELRLGRADLDGVAAAPLHDSLHVLLQALAVRWALHLDVDLGVVGVAEDLGVLNLAGDGVVEDVPEERAEDGPLRDSGGAADGLAGGGADADLHGAAGEEVVDEGEEGPEMPRLRRRAMTRAWGMVSKAAVMST